MFYICDAILKMVITMEHCTVKYASCSYTAARIILHNYPSKGINRVLILHVCQLTTVPIRLYGSTTATPAKCELFIYRDR